MNCQYCGRNVDPGKDGGCPYCGGNPGAQRRESDEQLREQIIHDEMALDGLMRKQMVSALTSIYDDSWSGFLKRNLWLMILGGCLGSGTIALLHLIGIIDLFGVFGI